MALDGCHLLELRLFFTITFGSIIGVGWMIVVGDWLRSAEPSCCKASWTLWLNAFFP